MAVMGAEEAKVVAAFTNKAFVPSVPMTVLPRALRVLPELTVSAALAVTGPEMMEEA